MNKEHERFQNSKTLMFSMQGRKYAGDILMKNIDLWKSLIANYNSEDKKQKRILWALYANISGGFYYLRDYNEALVYADKAKSIDYKNDYTYLSEFPNEGLENLKRKESLPENVWNLDFKNQNFANIEIVGSSKLVSNQTDVSPENQNKIVDFFARAFELESSFKFLYSISSK